MAQRIKGLGAINGTGAETAGLSIMAAMSVAGIWSALSPSWFTLSCFSKSEKEKAIGQKTLMISGAAGLVTSAGIYLVFGKLIPALAGALTTASLFVLGQYALSRAESAPDSPTMAPPKPAPLPENIGAFPRIRGLMTVDPRRWQNRAA